VGDKIETSKVQPQRYSRPLAKLFQLAFLGSDHYDQVMEYSRVIQV
jgi:hypothetical protein